MQYYDSNTNARDVSAVTKSSQQLEWWWLLPVKPMFEKSRWCRTYQIFQKVETKHATPIVEYKVQNSVIWGYAFDLGLCAARNQESQNNGIVLNFYGLGMHDMVIFNTFKNPFIIAT